MHSMMRKQTLQSLGLGSVLDIFKSGALPANPSDMVDAVFGPAGDRGSLVISGGNGIVGAGKLMQFGTRLLPYNIPLVALDMAGAPDGISAQYAGLEASFGREKAAAVMQNIFQLSYDGKTLPAQLKALNPRFLLEAIPEILHLKKAHYELFRASFPEVQIRSVTSGFPMKELGVGVAHPAFPHQINKVWEIVEDDPSDVTKLLWSLGMIPLKVSDDWSFVLDVLFCGITLAAMRYHLASNMPYWKVDKYVRRLLGPNPVRAHDAIGTKGSSFLTWSCLHHLEGQYGGLFTPSPDLEERKETGHPWYPLNHFRPLVNWTMNEAQEDDFNVRLLGPMFQMAALMLHENRAELPVMNAIGELCAQFRQGIVAALRSQGPEKAVKFVERYHELHPEAKANWHPEALADMSTAEWQQLYVNAEHDGTVGVITISRESYSDDVNDELGRAMDWLKAQGIERLILSGDFHISTQMVGADTTNFAAGLTDPAEGTRIAAEWSRTARRLNDEFKVSVGFVHGKRCMGGMLELMAHCHYLVADKGTKFGMPEVTLPVVPGMEGCHWPFRKAPVDRMGDLFGLLLNGNNVRAADAVGWLIDAAEPMDQAIKTAWAVASGGDVPFSRRAVEMGPVKLPAVEDGWLAAGSNATEGGRKAILGCIQQACAVPASQALDLQARISGDYMAGKECNRGVIGTMINKTMNV